MGIRVFPLSLLLIATCLLAGSAPAGTLYTATDLGAWAVNDVSDAGHATGFLTTGGALLWEDGSLTNIGTLGGLGAIGRSVNSLGQVVGESLLPSYDLHAFLWLPDPAYGFPAGMNDLGTLPGGSTSIAHGINDVGQVAGLAYINASDPHAFIYAGGVLTDLGTLGGAQSGGTGINESGQVSGASDVGDGTTHAILWLPSAAYGMPAGMNDLGAPAGGDSFAWAVNDLGQVAGWAAEAGGREIACLWDGGVMQSLGTLGGDSSVAGRINNLGQVIGTSEITPGDIGSVPFIYRDGAMHDLNDFIDPTSGWELTSAYGLNNSGQIVGLGRLNGEVAAYLLTPIPEPGTLLLAALGMLALGLARRTRSRR